MTGLRPSTWFVLGLMMGGLVGGALGLLLAPRPGEETRRQVGTRFGPGVEKIRDTATRLARRREPTVEEAEEPSPPQAEPAQVED